METGQFLPLLPQTAAAGIRNYCMSASRGITAVCCRRRRRLRRHRTILSVVQSLRPATTPKPQRLVNFVKTQKYNALCSYGSGGLDTDAEHFETNKSNAWSSESRLIFQS
jgi:hypothetical protein